MPVGSLIYRPEEQTRFCYFLTSGIASVVIPMAEGDSAEVVLIGKEGVTGCMQMLGPAAIPTCCFVQLAATGFRMRHDHLTEIFLECEETRSRILEFVQQESFTLSQVAGCNRLHHAEGRLARWLLMAQDRTGSAHLDFTQEFLGEMLALQRTTVSSLAAALHEAGHIDYARGRLTVIDRAGLERSACSCYPTTKKLLHGLYNMPWGLRTHRSRRTK